jgi:ribosomal protein S18 acetylase RimI-like enzyme
MSEEILICRAAVADAEIISAQRRGMFEDMGRGTPAELNAMVVAFIPWVADRIARGEYLGWFAKTAAGAVAAGAGMMLMDHPPSPIDLSGKRGYVLNVYVNPEFRRHGLARRLMATILEYCREQHIRLVELHASDAGRHLYESLGFKPTNEMRLSLVEGNGQT